MPRKIPSPANSSRIERRRTPSARDAADAGQLAKAESDIFGDVVRLIAASRGRALQAVNTALIELYWEIGSMISHKIKAAEWGEGVVDRLAEFIARTEPGLRGFTRRNLFRMRQFFEAYAGDAIVSPLVAQLPWSHHLIILGQSKRSEERRRRGLSRLVNFRVAEKPNVTDDYGTSGEGYLRSTVSVCLPHG